MISIFIFVNWDIYIKYFSIPSEIIFEIICCNFYINYNLNNFIFSPILFFPINNLIDFYNNYTIINFTKSICNISNLKTLSINHTNGYVFKIYFSNLNQIWIMILVYQNIIFVYLKVIIVSFS
jgi:hypothetical protein